MKTKQPQKSDLFLKFKSFADSINGELVTFRRHLHKYPEIGRQEFKTSQYIKEKISEISDLKITTIGETGFYADLIKSPGLPMIALRADLDALPLQDEKSAEYHSINNGVCHACGHDFHSTVVFGVLRTFISFTEYLKYNIRFIFQHAEEPTPGGALDFVEIGALDDIELIFGLHADPSLNTGQVGFRSGAISAQSIRLNFEICGSGGHTARPYMADDLNYIGTSLLHDLYGALYRKLDHNLPFVFSIGKIESGTSYNILPEKFIAEGTLRVVDISVKQKLLEFIKTRIQHLSEEYGVQINFNYVEGAPPVVNDKYYTEFCKQSVLNVIEQQGVVEMPLSMGGEDFGHYTLKCPGVFLKIGTGNDRLRAPAHTGKFDVDEQAIAFAVSVFSFLIANLFLKNN